VEHLAAVVQEIDMVAAGRLLHCSEERVLDWTASWAVDGAAGRALDGLAEKPPDGAWVARNGVDGLAGLEVAQHGLFPVVQLDQHRWYLV